METNKKYFNRLAGGAMLLAGAMAFAACSSDEDFADAVTPGAGATGETVKTQIAFNIPGASGVDKRMSAGNTQNTSPVSFLGMEGIYLIPLTAQASAMSTWTSKIPLNTFTSFSEGDNINIYEDVNVPVGTSHFLFYGQSRMAVTHESQSDKPASKFAYGSLNNTLSDAATVNASGIKFELEKLIAADARPFESTNATNVLNALNAVARTKYTKLASGESTWKEFANGTYTDGNDLLLKELYNNLVSGKAGAADLVRIELNNLKSAVSEIATSGTGDAKTLATAISTSVEGALTTLGTSNTFPEDVNLPNGVATISWANGETTTSGDPTAAYQVTAQSIGTLSYQQPGLLTYPANLAYYVATDLKATADQQATWPTASGNTWTSGVASWPQTSVVATTRKIALLKEINYGVGNLKTTVQFATASVEDNAKAMGGKAANNSITVGANSFELTGILVGGQPNSVNWEMLPGVSNATNNFTLTIYDKDINHASGALNTYVTTTVSEPNYTLVLANTLDGKATSEQSVVNIAVELKNNTGQDFYGKDGIVPNGGKFYLVGQLNPTSETLAGVTDVSVFLKDYTTTATVKISSLQSAYNTIPDLRANEMELGLSVDLVWTTGVSYDVEIQ